MGFDSVIETPLTVAKINDEILQKLKQQRISSVNVGSDWEKEEVFSPLQTRKYTMSPKKLSDKPFWFSVPMIKESEFEESKA